MQRILLFAAAMLLGLAANAQSPLWNRAVPGPAGQQTVLGDGRVVARSMALDRAGGVVVAGSMTAGAGRNFLTTKIGANGAIAWQQVFAGAAGGPDDAMSVAVDASGNAIVVGVTTGTAATDITVIKYAASNGRAVWERTLDYGRAEGGYFVAVDAAGNAVIAAETIGAAGHSDLRVIKLAAADGATLWDRVSDTGRDDFVSDIAVDANGDAVVLGISASATGAFDVRVLKLASADGAQRWAQALNFGGVAGAYSLALDAGGNVLVAGSAGTAANLDYRTAKLAAANGASLWQRDFEGGRHDHAQGVAVDAAGNAYVTGHSQNSAGRFVLKTLKYAAASGATLWEKTFDGGYNDYGYQVAVDAAGNALVVGSSTNAAGNTDWKVLVYGAASGDVLQEYSYAGAAARNDDAYAVAADSSGTFIGGLSTESGTTTTARVIKLAAAAAAPSTPGVSSNVALASAGAVATASSSGGAGYPASSVIDNVRSGLNWGNGGGWQDNTFNAYPDWVQVQFNGTKSIDRVVVYTLSNAYGTEPTDSTSASTYGVQAFTVEGWNGSSWQVLATVTGNTLAKRTVTFPAFSTDRIRINITAAAYYMSRIVEIEAWGVASGSTTPATPSTTPSNVALASAGTVATASSTGGAGYPVSSVIDDVRSGLNWGSGGGWQDGTFNAYPDWVQLQFNGAKTLDRVVVYTLSNAYGTEPGDATSASTYGVQAFTVEGWTGSAWQVLGSVTGNTLAKRTVTFPAFTTDRIRISVTAAAYYMSRIVEIEAWGVASGSAAPPAPSSNVALASAGAVATASSSGGAGYPVASVIDNVRSGLNWGSGGGWQDATFNAYPDWVQVQFNGPKSIDRVVVYTLSNAYGTEPGDATSASTYGVQSFTVEGWTGSSWQVLGTVTGNSLAKRTVTFPAFTTDRIRVNVTAAAYYMSRIVEIEAWGS